MTTPTPTAAGPSSPNAAQVKSAKTALRLACRELEAAGADRTKAAAAAWYSYPAILLALEILGDQAARAELTEFKRTVLSQVGAPRGFR